MKAFDDSEVLQVICQGQNKWGLYINIFIPDGIPPQEEINEILKAATFLNVEEHGQIIVDDHGWFLFDSKEEMETAYWQCIGDDGPSELNSYDGPVSIYALTCDPTGQLMNENT